MWHRRVVSQFEISACSLVSVRSACTRRASHDWAVRVGFASRDITAGSRRAKMATIPIDDPNPLHDSMSEAANSRSSETI